MSSEAKAFDDSSEIKTLAIVPSAVHRVLPPLSIDTTAPAPTSVTAVTHSYYCCGCCCRRDACCCKHFKKWWKAYLIAFLVLGSLGWFLPYAFIKGWDNIEMGTIIGAASLFLTLLGVIFDHCVRQGGGRPTPPPTVTNIIDNSIRAKIVLRLDDPINPVLEQLTVLNGEHVSDDELLKMFVGSLRADLASRRSQHNRNTSGGRPSISKNMFDLQHVRGHSRGNSHDIDIKAITEGQSEPDSGKTDEKKHETFLEADVTLDHFKDGHTREHLNSETFLEADVVVDRHEDGINHTIRHVKINRGSLGHDEAVRILQRPCSVARTCTIMRTSTPSSSERKSGNSADHVAIPIRDDDAKQQKHEKHEKHEKKEQKEKTPDPSPEDFIVPTHKSPLPPLHPHHGQVHLPPLYPPHVVARTDSPPLATTPVNTVPHGNASSAMPRVSSDSSISAESNSNSVSESAKSDSR